VIKKVSVWIFAPGPRATARAIASGGAQAESVGAFCRRSWALLRDHGGGVVDEYGVHRSIIFWLCAV